MGRIHIIGWHRYADVLQESSSPIDRDPRSCPKRPTMTYLARKSIPADLYESWVIQVIITLVSLAVVFMGTSIWAIVDATSKPPEAFVAIGSSKSTWIALIAVFTLFFGLVGFILALTYLFSVRPKITNWSQSTFVASPPVTSGRSWVSFLLWLLVGAAYAMVFLGAFAIGLFFIPVVIIATVLLVRRPSLSRGLPGLFGGLGLPLLYVAYLNRGGPGMVCTPTRSPYGVGQSCTQESNPWLWLMPGLLLIIVGVVVFMVTARSSTVRPCSHCAESLSPGAKFCTHCGTRSNDFTEAL